MVQDSIDSTRGSPVFNTIVWATDGSPNADRALSVAKALAHESRASLVAVHVVQRFASKRGLAVHADEENVEAKLKEVVDGLSAEGFDAALKIVNHIGPQAAHEIADVADDVGADLIVVGTRGYGSVAGLVLGSVTMRLLHVARCPVLAVPAVASRRRTRGRSHAGWELITEHAAATPRLPECRLAAPRDELEERSVLTSDAPSET